MPRRATARVNLAAIERNCGRLAGALTGGAGLCAVVKADAYGHGAAPCARAALAGGARMLAVATAPEARALRQELDEPAALLVMGAVSHDELDEAFAAGAEVVAWDERFVAALAQRAPDGQAVHAKLDTGMGRLGTRDPAELDRVIAAIDAAPNLRLAGVTSHFATADAPADRFFDEQLARFTAYAGPLKQQRPELALHIANSAATLRDPASHFDLVRCGIAVYGMDPGNVDPAAAGLEPALELRSYVAAVKAIAPGESTGYGRRFVAESPSTIAIVPIGYGDGVRRGLSGNADVLVGGARVPLVGTVSMDNIALDVGSRTVAVGDEAVLIGAQGPQRILAEELAARLATINYEITCGIGQRVPREHHRDGVPA